MMRNISLRPFHRSAFIRGYAKASKPPPIIRVDKGTFYRHHPNSVPVTDGIVNGSETKNPALFKNLSFEIDSFAEDQKFWAILGPSNAGKTTLMEVLRGQHICIPPTARTYPYLSSDEIDKKDHKLRVPSNAIQYVGFGGETISGSGQGPQGAYLSARYESRREETDWSVINYLTGNTELNPLQQGGDCIEEDILQRVLDDLKLRDLVDMPVANLSNGQTRRARIARAILKKPEVLLLDEPFMGLDPPTLMTLSPMLHRLAKAASPRLVLTLRPQDPIPDWITHLMFLAKNCSVGEQGRKDEVIDHIYAYVKGPGNSVKGYDVPPQALHDVGRMLTGSGVLEPDEARKARQPSTDGSDEGMTPAGKDYLLRAEKKRPAGSEANRDEGKAVEKLESRLSRDGYAMHDKEKPEIGETIIEMSGVRVAYGEKTVLGNWNQDVDGESKDGLWWNIRRGERIGIFGPNGSGKTTILSLICSDHPQTYSLPIKLFGRSRLPELGQPGISIFDIQQRIGHSSPEVQNFFPKRLTVRSTLESAWADTFLSKPKLDMAARDKVNHALLWFEDELKGSAQKKHEDDLVWADDLMFGRMPFSAQRVALFLRAIIKNPDLVILDEAFSGMDDSVRDKCMLFLAHGEHKMFSGTEAEPEIVESNVSKAGQVKVEGLQKEQALLCISHVKEEIPGSVREWVCLPEANTGKSARFGRLNGPIEGSSKRWNEIWDMTYNIASEPNHFQ